MIVDVQHRKAMDGIRSLIQEAADAFTSDINAHIEGQGRHGNDDMTVYHIRQLTLASMIRWQILDLSNEFHMHYAAQAVKPKFHGKLAAIRTIVVKMGDDFPAARMEADRLLTEANDRLNYLSVMMEADHAF